MIPIDTKKLTIGNILFEFRCPTAKTRNKMVAQIDNDKITQYTIPTSLVISPGNMKLCKKSLFGLNFGWWDRCIGWSFRFNRWNRYIG